MLKTNYENRDLVKIIWNINKDFESNCTDFILNLYDHV